jgi:diaminopimelate decarboxylase
VCYDDEAPPKIADFIAQVLQMLTGRSLQLVLEPGRSICADAGILLTRVEYLKTNEDKHFAIVDSGMNDLLRPSLYSAWQKILPARDDAIGPIHCYDIVGPICETGDFIGKQRQLVLKAGDILAVQQAGAYGFAMASNYNSRNRAAEVMVAGTQLHLIRQRETLPQQWADEHLLPDE